MTFADYQIAYENENTKLKNFFLFFIFVAFALFVSSVYLNVIKKIEIKFTKKFICSLNSIKNKVSEYRVPVDNDYTQSLLNI